MAVDTPSDGEVAAYQSSSGKFEWVASGGGFTSFTVAGDAGPNQTITDGNTLTLQGSGGITKVTMSATDTATFSLENTAVTPGSYTYASITVDAQGRLTAASSGTAPSDTTYTLAAAQSGSDAEIQLDASAGTDTAVKLAAGSNITLTESGGDTITIAAAGGSGIGGSISEDQVGVGSTTADEIEGSAGFTAALGGSGSTSVLKFGLSDGTTNYTRLRLNGTNAYLEFRDASDNQKAAIGFQSTQGLKFYAKAGGIGAAEALRITPNDEWGLQGTNYGTSGQVLTSGGTGAAVSWTTISGGGNDFNLELPGTDLNSAANNLYLISRQPGWGSNYSGSGTLNSNENPQFWPWISPVTGDMKCLIDVTSDGTGVLGIAIYSDNEGVPSSKIGGNFSYTFGSTGTGVKELTPASTVSVTRGTQYWIGVVETSTGNGAIRAENSSNSYNVAPVSGTLTSFLSITAVGVRLTNSDNTLPASITASDLSIITQGQPRWGAKFG